ncbi:hypothetical protein BOTCAL_0006g00430 [Botryotinia calthae]|uniref:Uncharacterized protein n=1 Tax=Botryotinia calthae TaxID=38488 RepID=A0A4Y8DH21_9HELO|nr:hypothetical protein BOTCAL_0006g00430 [Botryotinia calthae]
MCLKAVGVASGTVAMGFPLSVVLNASHCAVDGQHSSPGKQRQVDFGLPLVGAVWLLYCAEAPKANATRPRNALHDRIIVDLLRGNGAWNVPR